MKNEIRNFSCAVRTHIKASVRVAEKAGYHFETISREIWYNRGKYFDLLTYVLLREEFFGKS